MYGLLHFLVRWPPLTASAHLTTKASTTLDIHTSLSGLMWKMSFELSLPPVRARTLSHEWKKTCGPNGFRPTHSRDRARFSPHFLYITRAIKQLEVQHLPPASACSCLIVKCVMEVKSLECECVRRWLNPFRRLGRFDPGTPSCWWRLRRRIFMAVSWPMLETSWGISWARGRSEGSRQILAFCRLISATERSQALWSCSLQGAQLGWHQEDPQTFKYSWREGNHTVGSRQSEPASLATRWAASCKPVCNQHTERVKYFRGVRKTMIRHLIINHSGSQNWNKLNYTKLTKSFGFIAIFRAMIRDPHGKIRLKSRGVSCPKSGLMMNCWLVQGVILSLTDDSREGLHLTPMTFSSWRRRYWNGWMVVLTWSGSYTHSTLKGSSSTLTTSNWVIPACLKIQFEFIANYFSGFFLLYMRGGRFPQSRIMIVTSTKLSVSGSLNIDGCFSRE